METSAFFMNLLKHHVLHLKSFLNNLVEKDRLPNQQILTKIGASQMDLYLGELSPEEIFSELSRSLKELGMENREEFARWLHPKGYRKLGTSDGSQWILKLRENPDSFIHLHPARHSPLSLRIKGTTLKTTLVAAFHFKYHRQFPELKTLNELRNRYLNLSPTRTYTYEQKVFDLLCRE